MPFTKVTGRGWNVDSQLITAMRDLLVADGWTEIYHRNAGADFLLKMQKGGTAFQIWDSGSMSLHMLVGTHFVGTALQNAHPDFLDGRSDHTANYTTHICCFDEDIFIFLSGQGVWQSFFAVGNLNRFGNYSGGLYGIAGGSRSSPSFANINHRDHRRTFALMGGQYGHKGTAPHLWFQGMGFITTWDHFYRPKVTLVGIHFPLYSLALPFAPVFATANHATQINTQHLVGAFKNWFIAPANELGYVTGDIIDHNAGQYIVMRETDYVFRVT